MAWTAMIVIRAILDKNIEKLIMKLSEVEMKEEMIGPLKECSKKSTIETNREFNLQYFTSKP
jgi:hypothetical protein